MKTRLISVSIILLFFANSLPAQSKKSTPNKISSQACADSLVSVLCPLEVKKGSVGKKQKKREEAKRIYFYKKKARVGNRGNSGSQFNKRYFSEN